MPFHHFFFNCTLCKRLEPKELRYHIPRDFMCASFNLCIKIMVHVKVLYLYFHYWFLRIYFLIQCFFYINLLKSPPLDPYYPLPIEDQLCLYKSGPPLPCYHPCKVWLHLVEKDIKMREEDDNDIHQVIHKAHLTFGQTRS